MNGFIIVFVKNPNSVNVEATDAGINPIHDDGIDPIKTTDKSVITNTNTTTKVAYKVTHMVLSEVSIIEMNNIHIKLLINVDHIRGSASRGCVFDTLYVIEKTMTAMIIHTIHTNKTPLVTVDGIYNYKRYNLSWLRGLCLVHIMITLHQET